MTEKEEIHILRHKKLHKYFDELLADYIDNNKNSSIEDSIIKLVKWSSKQTKNPDQKK